MTIKVTQSIVIEATELVKCGKTGFLSPVVGTWVSSKPVLKS